MQALMRAQAGESLKILVVEDNPEDRMLYRRLLKSSGRSFDIRETASVAEGLAASREGSVDCVLLDYRLPDADGIEFIRDFRKNNPDTAVVMVTGQGCEQTAVEAMKLGALDYITKSSVSEGFFVQSLLNAVERARLKQELTRSAVAMSEFTRTVAHDLKAPLRRIISYCDILREETEGKLGAEAGNYVDRLSVNARRLQKLVDDLLTYARAVHSREEKEKRDLRKILDEVLEALGAVIAENGATIRVGEMPMLAVYPSRIGQLFQNLISNALKYRSAEAPSIDVACQDRDAYWLCAVRDNGLGIPPEFREKIFREFERLHSQDEIEGSGLGLAICRKAVEMHGGKIWVEAGKSGGSVFYFTLAKE
jgi:signal transduction histidine kinase